MVVAALLTGLLLAVCSAQQRPNMVIIIADDLGIGDLSCYGNRSFTTRHVDRLAAQGVLLTHHVAGAAMCTPSRTALLTGRYPVRAGMQESRHALPVITNVFSRAGLPPGGATFARALLNAGYRTKLVGKWHQGWSCERWDDQCHGPLGQGFQEFFGLPLTLIGFAKNSSRTEQRGEAFLQHVLPEVRRAAGACAGHAEGAGVCHKPRTATAQWQLWLAMARAANSRVNSGPLDRFLNLQLVRNNDIESWPYQVSGLTQRLLHESQLFIAASARRHRPFLLVHSFLHVHTPMFTAPPFRGVSGHSRYADNVLEMDWAVGRLLDSLEAAGVADNTIVHFVSDHGARLENVGADGQREGGTNWPFRGGKGQGGMEGGIRVPSIFRWPAGIPAGLRVHAPTSAMDLMPTLLAAAGVATGRLALDGRSMLDLLQGRSQTPTHRFMFHYCGSDVHAVRYTPHDASTVYKLYLKVPRYPDPSVQHCGQKQDGRPVCMCHGDDVVELSTPQLFDVQRDPSEVAEIPAGEARYKMYVPKMLYALEQHLAENIGVESQVEDFNLMIARPELAPWSQLNKFRGVDYDIEGIEEWLQFSREAYSHTDVYEGLHG